MSAFAGELLGTMILVLLGDGVVANALLKGTKGHGSGFHYINVAWGAAVFIAVAMVAPASGAHITTGASCRCFSSSAPVRFVPWKVMTIIRVM